MAYTVTYAAGAYVIEHPFYGTHQTGYLRLEAANLAAARMTAGLVRLNPRLPEHLTRAGVYSN